MIFFQDFKFLVFNHLLFLITVFVEFLLLQNLHLWIGLRSLILKSLIILPQMVVYISNHFHYHLHDIIFILNFLLLLQAFHRHHFLLLLSKFLKNWNKFQNFYFFKQFLIILRKNFHPLFPNIQHFNLAFEQTFAYSIFCCL